MYCILLYPTLHYPPAVSRIDPVMFLPHYCNELTHPHTLTCLWHSWDNLYNSAIFFLLSLHKNITKGIKFFLIQTPVEGQHIFFIMSYSLINKNNERWKMHWFCWMINAPCRKIQIYGGLCHKLWQIPGPVQRDRPIVYT